MKKHIVIADIVRSHNFSPDILNRSLIREVLESYVDADIYLARPLIEDNVLMFEAVCENYLNDKVLARTVISYIKENFECVKNPIVFRMPKSEQSPVTVYEEKKE